MREAGVTIKGKAKEIAALVVAIQERRGQEVLLDGIALLSIFIVKRNETALFNNLCGDDCYRFILSPPFHGHYTTDRG